MVQFVANRDATDHLRFSPIQTELAKDLCTEYKMPTDLSTAVLIDEEGGHIASNAILRQFAFMGFPYNALGFLALLIPKFIRNYFYYVFARNRGAIWKFVKRMIGLGDTYLREVRGRVVGLQEPIPPGWGFGEEEQKL